MPRLSSIVAPIRCRRRRWVRVAAGLVALLAAPAAAEPQGTIWNRPDRAELPADPPALQHRVPGRLAPGPDIEPGTAPRPGLFLHPAAGLRLGLRAGYDRRERGLRAMLALEFDF